MTDKYMTDKYMTDKYMTDKSKRNNHVIADFLFLLPSYNIFSLNRNLS